MRSAHLSAAWLLSLGLLTTAPSAHADNPYSCMGMGAPTVRGMTIAVQTSPTAVTELYPAAVVSVLDLAECQCNSSDLFIEAQLMTGIPNGSQPNFSVWAGSNCTASTRATTCEQIMTKLGPSNFWTGGLSVNTLCNGSPCQPVPISSVIEPAYTGNTNAHLCTGGTTTNGIWFLFGDLSAPDSCTIRLDALLTPPDAPTSIAALSGDGAVNVTWQAPAQGTARPTHYQVLCGEAGPNDTAVPVMGQGAYAFGESSVNKHQLAYSTCTAKGLQRRSNLPTTGPAASNPDGGTTTTLDASAGPVDTGGGTLGIETDPPDLGSMGNMPDLGSTGDMLSSPDMGTTPIPTMTTGSKHFPFLDKSFVCSDILTGDTNSQRITGLINEHQYWFLVVGTDDHGNSSISGEVSQKPQAVEDLYRRYAADGGKGQGFCFIATAAYGSYQHPFVRILRDFRDGVLLPTETGSAFVAWYYRTSPPIAAFIQRHDVARFVVRLLLWPVIAFAWLWLALGGLVSLVVWAGAIAAVVYRKRLGRLVLSPAAESSAGPGRGTIADEAGALATTAARSRA